MRPNILITCGKYKNDTGRYEYRLSKDYTDAVLLSKGVPYVYTGGAFESAAELFDALILSGGGDVLPCYFGESLLSDTLNIDEERDLVELSLISEFSKLKKPILGICRGMQVINVAFGGTLWQDLEEQAGIVHTAVLHEVEVLEKSFLSQIMPKRFVTNSFHHQAVKKLAPDLFSNAVCGNIIEGIRHRELPIFGVQWHPERLTEENEESEYQNMLPLFKHFVNLAGWSER